MKNAVTTGALALLLATATTVTSAQADRRHGDRDFRSHHAYNSGHRHHQRGYWRNGKWIALGILGAAAAGAFADDDCYRTRRGRVVCD